MSDKTIVLTMYGKDDAVESISIKLFDKTVSYIEKNQDALKHCDTINDLKLENDQWVQASIIGENEKISLKKRPTIDILNCFDIRAVQKVLREISKKYLAYALIGADDETKEKIFKSMSSRAVKMIKEDMEALKPCRKIDVKSSQEKIVEIICRFENSGEIVLIRK
jgi:flagellar motor switch protein FliG